MIGRLRLWFALLLVPFCLGLAAPATHVFAADPLTNICNQRDKSLPTPPSCQNINNNGNPLFGPDGVLTKAINILSLIGGVVTIIVILVGGVKFITSSGDPSSVTSARNTILYAVIALLIMVSAQTVVRLVLSKL